MEYEKELREAILVKSDHTISAYLRIVTRIMGLDIKDYRRIIKQIYESHLAHPDLDL